MDGLCPYPIVKIPRLRSEWQARRSLAKKKEERKKKNGGGEAVLRILYFYILISTFYIDTVISTEAERSD